MSNRYKTIYFYFLNLFLILADCLWVDGEFSLLLLRLFLVAAGSVGDRLAIKETSCCPLSSGEVERAGESLRVKDCPCLSSGGCGAWGGERLNISGTSGELQYLDTGTGEDRAAAGTEGSCLKANLFFAKILKLSSLYLSSEQPTEHPHPSVEFYILLF